MRTGGRFEAKTPFTDGRIVVGAQDLNFTTGGVSATLTLNAKGDLSQNLIAATAFKAVFNLSQILLKTGQLPFLQEQFGTAAGVAGPTVVANTSDPDAQSGIPPFTGASQLTPQTGFFPKGINILDVTLKYLVTTNPLSVHTLGISKSVFANNAAIVVTDVLANAANGLATAAQANPYVTKITVNSGFLVTDLADIIIEWDVTTPAGGTARLYGMDIHVQYNWN